MATQPNDVDRKPVKLVASKVFETASLLSSRSLLYHPHFLPSSILYVFYGFLHFKFQLGSSQFAFFYLILTLFIHLLLFLVPQWSIQLKAGLWYRNADIENADSILIIPTVSNGKAAVCPIERENREIWFLFQKKVRGGKSVVIQSVILIASKSVLRYVRLNYI